VQLTTRARQPYLPRFFLGLAVIFLAAHDSSIFLNDFGIALPRGTPNATMAGHRVQISASLSGGNPFETYICNSSGSPLRAGR
jgi:hypothetical protein